VKPRYPIFVPSKGRAEACQTAAFLLEEEVEFRLVVEPSEEEVYRARFPNANLLVTPHDNMRLLGVRNWIRDVSEEEGAARHWQLDDNIWYMARFHRGLRQRVHSSIALCTAEDFTDRYTNIGITGFDYWMFAIGKAPPFRLNNHVYSASLINNAMPYRWRLLYNDDTDLCLQVLSGGLCTVQINAFLIHKIGTMRVKGGNTDDLYQGDGRLRMARELERYWPGIVTTERRFNRPQHVVRGEWRMFDTQLIRRDDVDFENLDNEKYRMTLHQLERTPGWKSPTPAKPTQPGDDD
jgi:hypothetical protein